MERIAYKLTRFFGHWLFSVLDPVRGRWIVDPFEKNLAYLKAMNARGFHILIKPSGEREPFFMLYGDLKKDDLNRDHKSGSRFKPDRLVVETSPANYQVGIHSNRPLSDEEKMFWLKKMGSDSACFSKHRWGRSPGFRNKKDKYKTREGHPLAKLIWVDWQKQATIPKADLAPLQKPPVSKIPDTTTPFEADTIERWHYERGNESATDFAYTLALLRRGVSEENIRERLLKKREDWTHHKGERRQGHYLKTTIQAAKKIIN